MTAVPTIGWHMAAPEPETYIALRLTSAREHVT